MAKSLTIPNASPLKWVIENGTGTINDGLDLRDNSAWPSDQFICNTLYPAWCHRYDCSDSTDIQINHQNDDDPDIVMELLDNDTNTVQMTTGFTVADGNQKNGTLDFSTGICGECHRVLLYTLVWSGVNLWLCGDSGTFEAAIGTWSAGVQTGGNNTITASATAQSGSQSAQINADPTPTPGSAKIINCVTDQSLLTYSYYRARAWIRDSSSSPFTQDGDLVEIKIGSGFAAATVISQTTVVPSSAGRDTWHQIELIFFTGNSLTGNIHISATQDPQTSGIILVDTITLEVATQTLEATSEDICIENLDACWKKVEYYSEEPSHNTFFAQNAVTLLYEPNYLVRVPIKQNGERYEDPQFTTFRSSAGVVDIVSSKSMRVYENVTDFMPPFAHHKFALAMKHGVFKINNIEYRNPNPGYNAEYPDGYLLGKADFDLIDSDYDEDFTYC